MGKVLDYNAVLVDRIDLTDALTIFRVELTEEVEGQGGEGLWFVPGQYMVIGMNNEAQPELGSVLRPMSIASAADVRKPIDFYIRYVSQPESDNPLTHLLWKLKVGDPLFVRPKARGKFTVVDTVGESESRLHVFVSAGTGSAPFVSIVDTFHNQNPDASLSHFAILHGASYPQDLGYREHLTSLADSHGLRYIPTVSRPNEAGDWTGTVGRVEDLFLPERLAETEQLLGLDAGKLTPANAVVWICGLQGTIGKTIERLASRGFVPDHKRMRKAFGIADDVADSIYFEQYDSEPVLDLEDEALMKQLGDAIRDAD
ncbi:MAG: hypothetical protein AAF581_14625 [Planctomycetota bacterium]